VVTAKSHYDKAPVAPVSTDASLCLAGWRDILDRLRAATRPGRFVICVECYPGAFVNDISRVLCEGFDPALCIHADECFRTADRLNRMLEPVLTEDPVFGRMSGTQVCDFLEPEKLALARRSMDESADGLILIIGTGASLVATTWDLLIYANMARWEIQQRQRRNEVGNLGLRNLKDPTSTKYKRAFFVDWRAADRLKRQLYGRIDFLLDTNDAASPKMISGDVYREALAATVRRPFRVVPFFDPGPWGGQWMRSEFDLPSDASNFAWGFDCVPEENSLLLGFGHRSVEVPAIDLVFRHPQELLGECVYSRFGAEFPIRFDLLDTMGGGNLSLQVHPMVSYIRQHFGMTYTQDESYYLLAASEGAAVYLGLREGVDRRAFAADLERAQNSGVPFPAERYINVWPARRHDHFLIPAGTVHCSGRNCVVLEVSATPYIFTFKLWDWGRPGLDGEPRPVHLEHGMNNLQWERTTAWVRRELINHVEPAGSGPGWSEERTGLHELEFIETRRHWFTGMVPHDTHGTVNVLNLVQGAAAVVESPQHAFEPFLVHYAETFIVPAAVGSYTVRPVGAESPCATMKAYVRTQS
jgi:mannose-6-phosphate isomerase class I